MKTYITIRTDLFALDVMKCEATTGSNPDMGSGRSVVHALWVAAVWRRKLRQLALALVGAPAIAAAAPTAAGRDACNRRGDAPYRPIGLGLVC